MGLAIQQMNFLGLSHRDIKPKNFVIDIENNKLVLIEFELSAILEEGVDGRARGTPGFFLFDVARTAGSKAWDL